MTEDEININRLYKIFISEIHNQPPFSEKYSKIIFGFFRFLALQAKLLPDTIYPSSMLLINDSMTWVLQILGFR